MTDKLDLMDELGAVKELAKVLGLAVQATGVSPDCRGPLQRMATLVVERIAACEDMAARLPDAPAP